MPRLTIRFWRRAALVALVLVLLWLGSAFAVTWRLTHRRAPRHPEPAPAIEWGALRELRLSTADGEELGAWWIEGHEPRAAALLLHGNEGGRGESLSTARILVREGVACLLLTLRAHGDSSGETNDLGWGSRADVVAGVAEIERAHSNLPVLVRRVSLGPAAAIFARGRSCRPRPTELWCGSRRKGRARLDGSGATHEGGATSWSQGPRHT